MPKDLRQIMKNGQKKRSDRSALASADAASLAAFERQIARAGNGRYILRLFVTGMTVRSQRAIENVRRLCDEHLPGRYELQIIDIYQDPEIARDEQIIAAPTLLKKLPPPLRRVIGDLSEPGRVLVALGLRSTGD
jgi:circadian clock protein KaiB